MSREVYSISQSVIRSPGRSRRLTELPTVDRSPSREYLKREISSNVLAFSPFFKTEFVEIFLHFCFRFTQTTFNTFRRFIAVTLSLCQPYHGQSLLQRYGRCHKSRRWTSSKQKCKSTSTITYYGLSKYVSIGKNMKFDSLNTTVRFDRCHLSSVTFPLKCQFFKQEHLNIFFCYVL